LASSRSIGFLLAGPLFAACASPARNVEPAPASTSIVADSGGLLRPDQILSILEDSGIHYRIVSDGEVAHGELIDMLDPPVRHTGPVDPFFEVVRRDDGRPHLKSSRPSEDVEELFTHAREAFDARQFEIARDLYLEAAKIEPGYFKTYTYVGNALFWLGDYRRAEVAFEHALEINPVDYQALLFLGDTHYQLGDYVRSKEILTRAFMLNRTNPLVLERLQASLAKLDLRVRSGRLEPNVRIERVTRDRVDLHFDKESGMRWLALTACVACWAYEDQCRERAPEDEDPLRIRMYRECLINQAASIAVRKAKDQTVGADEEVLLDAIENGFLEAIIFWEVIAKHAPLVILLLPDEVQRDILRYIQQYVFVSTQVV
jgi:tetratricopeptide (TPR) repeat protein